MSDVVISVDGLSKKYRLGSIGTGTLSRDLNIWWSKFRGRGNPYEKIGIEGSVQTDKNDFWALKDINFDVKRGEAVGIIGKNGAGKSTLLKILSRITSPSSGEIRIDGHIASLLEVGTGFHPELTGRENIFLNGAILGMSKREIRSKIDEIIAFSGVERHIDTPVKRYSSGMYVRLAFAVAAHLEPDILIVDEVLAVGDAEFQKKCMGKMKEVMGEGRTILFVSHNMQAINNLCSRAVWLQNGRMCADGDTKTIVNNYLTAYQKKLWSQKWDSLQEAPGNEKIKFQSVELVPHVLAISEHIDTRTSITVKFRIQNFCSQLMLTADILLFTSMGECIFDISTRPALYNEGIIEGECTIPGNFLNDGSYYFSIYLGEGTTKQLYYLENCLNFEVEDYREDTYWYDKWWGYVRPNFPLSLKNIPVPHSNHSEKRCVV